MQFELIKITPAAAEAYLASNTRNRRIVPNVVAGYARDMAAGAWAPNGEAIKIAADGTILDGQHRLQAIAQAGITVEMLVITGLDPETQKTMDGGRKRTLSDNLGIDGVHNSAVVASITLRGWLWDSGDTRLSRTVRPTQAEQRAWLEQNPGAIRAAEVASRTYSGFPAATQSISGIAHVLFSRIDVDVTARFFAGLETGGGLEEGHPMLLLRGRLVRDYMNKVKEPDGVKLALYIKTWNSMRNGEKPGALLMTAKNHMPIPE